MKYIVLLKGVKMKYIILLRGVNISGKNKVSMPKLKQLLEENKYQNVSTYLNSGNIIIESNINNKELIIENISKIIEFNFNIKIPIYIMTVPELEDILNNSPSWWGTTNKEIYDNLIFIIPPTTYEEVHNTIDSPKENIDQIEEYYSTIFWSFVLKDYRKSTWWIKTANTSITNKITIRTASTMKKLLQLSQK